MKGNPIYIGFQRQFYCSSDDALFWLLPRHSSGTIDIEPNSCFVSCTHSIPILTFHFLAQQTRLFTMFRFQKWFRQWYHVTVAFFYKAMAYGSSTYVDIWLLQNRMRTFCSHFMGVIRCFNDQVILSFCSRM